METTEGTVEMCVSGDHPEDERCSCEELECGHIVDLDLQNKCSNCSSCEECCECRFCEGCNEHKDEDDFNGCKCHYCDQCCECIRCRGCRTWYSNECHYTCNNCDLVEDCCCECSNCQDCGERFSSVCENNRCNGCCDGDCCGGSRNISLLKHYLNFHKSDSFSQNKLRRFLSTEIELSGCSDGTAIHDVAYKWDDGIVEDGSLPDAGFEINLNPTNGDLFLKRHEEYAKAFQRSDVEVNESCGVHVHVCAKDFSVYDIRRMVILYDKFERPLFEMHHLSRLNGHYSAVCGKYYRPTEHVPNMFRRELFGKLYLDGHMAPEKGDRDVYCRKRDKYQNCRYKALNVHSYFLRKTFEFRHMAGTTNLDDVVTWALVCGWLVEIAYKMSESELSKIKFHDREALIVLLPASLTGRVRKMWAEHDVALTRNMFGEGRGHDVDLAWQRVEDPEWDVFYGIGENA